MKKTPHRYSVLLEALNKRITDPLPPEGLDRLSAMALCTLAGDGGFHRARNELEIFKAEFVDFNEMRVARVSELSLLAGGGILHGWTWSRCNQLRQLLRTLFANLGNLDVITPLKDAGSTEIKRFLGQLSGIKRDTINLIRMVVFEENNTMLADQVLYDIAKALGFLVKGMTRFDFVKEVLRELEEQDAWRLYCLLREFRDECRDEEGRFIPEKAREFSDSLYKTVSKRKPTAGAEKKSAVKRVPAGKDKKPVRRSVSAGKKKKTQASKATGNKTASRKKTGSKKKK